MTEPDDIGGEFRHDLKDIIKTHQAKTLDDVIDHAESKGFRRKQNISLPLTRKQEKLMAKVVLKYGDKAQRSTIARPSDITRYGKPVTVHRDILTGRFMKRPEIEGI